MAEQNQKLQRIENRNRLREDVHLLILGDNWSLSKSKSNSTEPITIECKIFDNSTYSAQPNLDDHFQPCSQFCGKVARRPQDIDDFAFSDKTLIYVTGDIQVIYPLIQTKPHKQMLIIEKYSYNYNDVLQDHKDHKDHKDQKDHQDKDNSLSKVKVINMSQLPCKFGSTGVFVQNFFTERWMLSNKKRYFDAITQEHQFQSLTESNKPTFAFRKGIYLTPVTRMIKNEESNTNHNNESVSYDFHLLRCSSNLNGPTDNFRETDHKIVDQVNEFVQDFFEKPVTLNHVLAQVYHNQPGKDGKKAKIKAHSDKTKDMPDHALIAFCTFYDRPVNDPNELTRLKFVWKKDYREDVHPESRQTFQDNFPMQFSVTLDPGSLFVIPLSTNALYTHEIKPSSLTADRLPTRLGYVIRCSNTQARFQDGQTFIKQKEHGDNNQNNTTDTGNASDDASDTKETQEETWKPMTKMTAEEEDQLRNLYYQENTTSGVIVYPEMNSSMNQGDYQQPLY